MIVIMKFNISKKQVFRWYLANAVLVLSAFTQNSIAQNEYLSNQDVLNICNQLSWRAIANNAVVEAEEISHITEGSWITDGYYSGSVRNVIGKAIADCLTEDNEFAGKKAGDVITFDVDAKTFTAENWNAVDLWILIHVYTYEYKTKGECNTEQAFNEVNTRIKTNVK